MAHYDQHQAPVVYPPAPPQSYQPPQQQAVEGPYVTAPPPVGYPTKDDSLHPKHNYPVEHRSKGDDFWKGCLAALCCCCVLDCCFC